METDRIVEQAIGEVDPSLLEGSGAGGILSVGYFGDGPLLDRLREGEGIHYALQNYSKGLTIGHNGDGIRVKPGGDYRAALLVTDSRLLFVVGQADGDESFSVPFETVTDVRVSTGVLKDRVTVYSERETYDMYVQKGSDIEAIRTHLLEAAKRAGRTESADADPGVDERETGEKDADGGDTDGGDEAGPTFEEAGSSGNTKTMVGAPNELDVLVASPEGEPVTDATIRLETDSRSTSASTGPTGRARIEFPADSDQAEIEVEHPSYGTTYQQLTLTGGRNIEVSLPPADTGSTRPDESDNPAAGDESDGSQSTGADGPPSEDELLEELKALDEQGTRRVTRGRMRAAGRFEPEQYEAVFGTWSAAIEAMESSSEDDEATSPANQGQPSKEEVLEAIAEVAKQVDGRPTTTEMHELGRISATTAYRYFDSWDDAVSAALEKNEEDSSTGRAESSTDTPVRPSTDGTETPADDEGPTEEALLEEINRLKDAWGRVPSRSEMANHGQYSPRQYERVFGTWSEAVRAAGFEPRGSNDPEYTRDEVITAIRDVASNVEGPPTVHDINEHAPMSASVLYNYFDSIPEAREAARATEVEPDPVPGSDDGPDSGVTDEEDTPDSDESAGSSRDAGDISGDPLADGLEEAPEGRLSEVVVEVLEESDPDRSRRTAKVDLRTAGGEEVILDIWEKHDVDWDFEAGDRLRLEEVSLKRWSIDGTLSHELSTTRDFSATEIGEGAGVEPKGGDENDEGEDGEDERSEAIRRITGLGGTTENDAEVLVEAGYESRSDLEAASLEELRSLPELDDGIALRIKAELG